MKKMKKMPNELKTHLGQKKMEKEIKLGTRKMRIQNCGKTKDGCKIQFKTKMLVKGNLVVVNLKQALKGLDLRFKLKIFS